MFTKTNKHTVAKSFGAFALLSTLVLTSFSTSIGNNNLKVQAAASSANLIIGMVDKGTNYEVSACLQSTSGVQHLTDSSTWFNYNSTQVTANPTLVTRGIYNTVPSFAPMGWVSVFPNTIYGMSTISISDTPNADSIVPTTGAGLIGRGAFNKVASNSPSTSITLNKGLFYSLEGASDPTTVNVINSNADCTLYGAIASSSSSSSSINSSSSAAISSSMSSSAISSSSSVMSSSAKSSVANVPASSAMAAAASNTIRTGGTQFVMYSSVVALNIIGLAIYNKRRNKINKIDIN